MFAEFRLWRLKRLIGDLYGGAKNEIPFHLLQSRIYLILNKDKLYV